MKPFCGYDFGDYFAHWLSFGATADRLPKVFHVNWFRKGADGHFLWPGFGDNLRVLEWMIHRVEGRVAGVETPIGTLPAASELNLEGLTLDRRALDALLEVDNAAWQDELAAIGEYLDSFAPRLPASLKAEQKRVARALASAAAVPHRKVATS